ncbi:MAG: AI-2E family transporter [Pseudomonadales bacterium]|jgi:predicted PurR-regulated permease PerM|nr:AI-2E family transporter [Pseudomonadales bacterium]
MRQIPQINQVKALFPWFVLIVAAMLTWKIIGSVSGIWTGISQFLFAVSPFFYGFIIAYVLGLPRSGIKKLLGKVKNKWINKYRDRLSIVLTYIVFLLVVFLILSFVVPAIYDSVILFISSFSLYYQGFQNVINYINNFEYIDIQISEAELFNWLVNMDLSNLTDSFAALAAVPFAVFRGFLAFVASIYIMWEQEKVKNFLKRLYNVFSSVPVHATVIKYVKQLDRNFKQYIYAQTLDGFILGTVVAIQLWLFGSPYALVLGIMLGVFNYVPYFGSFFGSLIAILVVAFTQELSIALLFSIVLIITQQLDATVLQPRLMSKTFKVSPLLVLISITVGNFFAGVLGMLIAIPIAAVLRDILDDMAAYYEQKKLVKSRQSQ